MPRSKISNPQAQFFAKQPERASATINNYIQVKRTGLPKQAECCMYKVVNAEMGVEAMEFSYLDGKCWADVTREERFFCQRLFTLAGKDRGKRILSRIRDRQGNPRRLDGQWEPAFEVCFFRDLLHFRRRKDSGCKPKCSYSLKRTFDLVFFSERAIVILEAKAQQGFRLSQFKDLESDRESVKRLTGISDVWIYGVVSSLYKPRPETIELFDGPLLKWRDLAESYNDDKVLERADAIYGD